MLRGRGGTAGWEALTLARGTAQKTMIDKVGQGLQANGHVHDGKVYAIFSNVIQILGETMWGVRFGCILFVRNNYNAVLEAIHSIAICPVAGSITGIFDASTVNRGQEAEDALVLFREGIKNRNVEAFAAHLSNNLPFKN
ncbi:hypothetical protein SUGI_1016170 [Cryptomeria japonica]|nr:hypothetical protein SUGI_1016170 [Cryptomeria japonica]